MAYAFTFDASACTGCKACQVACKDKNNLPVGILWRRVYEVSGGAWMNTMKDSSAPGIWQTDVFAYNLSMACNHCIHPKCAGVCPTNAYIVRDDGIVYIDGTKCMGCGYCAWACPYSAPQYDHGLQRMTKCDFCYDHLDLGLPPACVAACPMRVLDVITLEGESSIRQDSKRLWELPGSQHPFPLPQFSRTEPHLVLHPHSSMGNELEKSVSNREEVNPPRPGHDYRWDELPLVLFTLSGQMAVGLGLFSLFSDAILLTIRILIGAMISCAGLVSFLHLGRPVNSWRAINHLQKSWLSREILAFGLFSASWLFSLFFSDFGKLPLALTGIGLVYSMAQVYRLRSVPSWSSPRTLLAFTSSTLLLGGLVYLTCRVFQSNRIGPLPSIGWILIGSSMISVFFLSLPVRKIHAFAGWSRIILTAIALVSFIFLIFYPGTPSWFVLAILLFSLLGEILGRWLFYISREPIL